MTTPIAQHFKLSLKDSPEIEEDKAYMKSVHYANVVGTVMYAMICARPDLAYAVSVVSRYMRNPGKLKWEAVKLVFIYLKVSSRMGLKYVRNDQNKDEVVGFVDELSGDQLVHVEV